MTNNAKLPDVSNAVKFPKGSFQKTYDTILLEGEVYRSKLHKSQLKPDETKLYIDLKISKEDFVVLRAVDLDNKRKLTGVKKVEIAVKDENGSPVLDDEGEKVKKFSHYQISLRQNAMIKGQDAVLKVVTVDGKPFDTSQILGEGSKVKVLGHLYVNDYQGKPQMGLNMDAIVVLEANILAGGGYNPFADMGFDFENPFDDRQASSEVQDESAKGDSKSNKSSGIGDIPFGCDEGLDDDNPFA